jgi:hypothetical protein
MASDSDSDSDDFDGLKYKTCQQICCDCNIYVKKRYVVNNDNNGEIIVLCDNAIRRKKNSKCSYCQKLCVYAGLSIDKDFNLCVPCCRNGKTTLSSFIAKKYSEDKTFISEMFNAFLPDAKDCPPNSDVLFKLHADIFTLHRNSSTADDITISDNQLCLIQLSTIIANYPEKYEKLKSALMNDFIKFKQEHDDKKRRKIQAKEKPARDNAKRIIRAYCSESFDEIVDKIVDSKKQRVVEAIPISYDVSDFVKWLKK